MDCCVEWGLNTLFLRTEKPTFRTTWILTYIGPSNILEGKQLRSKSKKWNFRLQNLIQYIYIYLTIFHLFLEFKIWGNMTRPNEGILFWMQILSSWYVAAEPTYLFIMGQYYNNCGKDTPWFIHLMDFCKGCKTWIDIFYIYLNSKYSE